MMTSRIRTMLLGGAMLFSAGCMAPMYRLPAGYSGSYHRYLNGTLATPAGPAGDEFSKVPAGPAAAPSEMGNRPSVTAMATGSTAAPSAEHPPIPPRS